MDDWELVRRCIDGEEGAWRGLVDRYAPYLSKILGDLLRGQPASLAGLLPLQDALQDCFLLFWRENRKVLRAYDGRVPLHSYLRVIAIHCVLNRLESLKRFDRSRIEPPFPVSEAATDHPREQASLQEESERILAILEQLSPKEKLLWTWIRRDGISYGKAASLLDLSPNSVGPTLARIESRIRRMLENEK